MQRIVLPFLAAVLFCACRNAPADAPSIRVLSTRTMAELPSASAITRAGDRFLVNADNAPFLYVLDADGRLVDSMELLHENSRLHEIPKPAKPDYEAAAMVGWRGQHVLLLFGSGTVSPTRDSLLVMGLSDPLTSLKADLRPFYTALIRSGIPARSLNIEAAASTGSSLLLFNRGTDAIIQTDRDSFMAAILGSAPLPGFSVHTISLPGLNGYPVGISGASMLDDSTVLLCGSVEATTDWAKDGEILGSGIGLLRLSAIVPPRLLRWTMLADTSGRLLHEKLEGIELLRRKGHSAVVRCVADNDNGSSTLLDLELRLNGLD